MKSYQSLLLALGSLSFFFNVSASVLYVDINGTNATSPYAGWTTAATNIQDAIDASTDGDTVLVADGIYRTGGRLVFGPETNRVAVTNAITIQSANGPQAAIIEGYQVPFATNSRAAIRCVYLGEGATLIGFTLTRGATLSVNDGEPPYSERSGGGVYCEQTAVVSNCVLSGNASEIGGGANGGTINNSILSGNWSTFGGGAASSILNNCAVFGNNATSDGGGTWYSTVNSCTLTGNSAATDGGADNCQLTNCIVYYNTPVNYLNCYLAFSCTTPLPDDSTGSDGTNNIADEPQLADAFHLTAASPCRGAGNADSITGTDIDGEAWATPPAIGCDEYVPGGITGPLLLSVQASYTNVTPGFVSDFAATIVGHASASRWDFGDGTIVSNRISFSHSWAAPGNYPVVLRVYNETFPGGVASTTLISVVSQPVQFVSLLSTNPVSPFTSWATAATNIQDALDASYGGGGILVSNGLYATGVTAVNGVLNRVVANRAVALRSVNGPAVTFIQGQPGDNPIRCIYLGGTCSLSGFTLANGHAFDSGEAETQCSGGGVWCESAANVVSNCVFLDNGCGFFGGGAYGGTVNNSFFSGNSADDGGGANFCTLNNCLLTGNFAQRGGGASGCTANNCTLTGNQVGGYGGGATSSTLNNCILYYDINSFDTNSVDEQYNCSLAHCCSLVAGELGGNLTNAPLFVDRANGNFHLQNNSPCINSGQNAFVATAGDLDGNPRIDGGTVDIGAYEIQNPASILSYAWAQQYSLPVDGSVDFLDLDGTGLKTWQKWIAGLNPTNHSPGLAMLPLTNSIDPPGVTVSWQSVNTRTYNLLRATSLAAPAAFACVQSNIFGQGPATSVTDTTATNGGPYFYRVTVSIP